jgi:hypothetical protein
MCNDPIIRNEAEEVFLRSYVMNYYEPREIKLAVLDSGNGISFYFVTDWRYYGWSYTDNGSKKAIYDVLCEKNGDMTFNRAVWIGPAHPKNEYMSTNFVSIDVVSNADFDDQHPAGTSLADVIRFNATSAKPYIDSGYVEYEWGSGNKTAYYPIRKMLSEITPYDLVLLGDGELIGLGGGQFVFESQPTLSKEHTFTVTFTDDEGTIMSDSIEKAFE